MPQRAAAARLKTPSAAPPETRMLPLALDCVAAPAGQNEAGALSGPRSAWGYSISASSFEVFDRPVHVLGEVNSTLMRMVNGTVWPLRRAGWKRTSFNAATAAGPNAGS